ncbi:hypothetical protein L6164_010997 [Bauhinia variegata]|uniref:Uncharacterized protein n=1 Tax=Bauhinia variegata TaxID=167791 RepID=A0ACB9P5S4_BAUVA|nr:hypothetical protein L6164_010997 [Bauhinia variegata]
MPRTPRSRKLKSYLSLRYCVCREGVPPATVRSPVDHRPRTTATRVVVFLPMEETTFQCDLIHSILKLIWSRRALEREKLETSDALDSEVGAGTSRKNRPTSANANALKLTCELLRVFITEAVQRSAAIAEAEGLNQIEATHLESILPQLLLDF